MKIVAATLTEKQNIGLKTFRYTFRLEKQLNFKPGQYVWIILQCNKEREIVDERRAFSIASSSADQDSISVVFRKSESKYKQKLLQMPVGTKIRIKGPHGQSFLVSQELGGKKLYLISGGVGIAPFLSILSSLSATEFSVPPVLVHFDRFPETALNLTEFETFVQKGFTISRHLGTISKEIASQVVSSTENCLFLICGSQTHVNITAKALSDFGISRSQMVFEQFYPNYNQTKFRLASDISQISTTRKVRNTLVLGHMLNNMLQSQVQQLVELERNYRLAIESSSNHTIITDTHGTILFANPAAQLATGYSFEEMLGQTPRLWGGLMPESFYKELWSKINVGFAGEITNTRKSGENYTAIARISPIKDDSGRPVGYIATEEDIDYRIKLEENLAAEKLLAEERTRRDEALLSSIGEGVIGIDKEGLVISSNQAATEILLYERPELIGHRFTEVIQSKDLQGKEILGNARAESRANTENKKFDLKVWYLRKDGKDILAKIICTPVIIGGQAQGAVIVFRDITEDEKIDQAKTEFISLASHQLRTPLTTIRWYIEMLLDPSQETLTAEQRDMLHEIDWSSEKMDKLVSALLNITRVESGNYKVDLEPTDIKKLLEDVISESKPAITTKQLSIDIHSQPDLPELMLDSSLLRIVLQNLITNAVKYSRDGMAIQIILNILEENADRVIYIEVQDSGIGIPVAQQSQVFSKLFRADNARKTKSDGTGLGLYLAKSIVEDFGGKIWFNSQENLGTTFYVKIPLSGMVRREGTKEIMPVDL